LPWSQPEQMRQAARTVPWPQSLQMPQVSLTRPCGHSAHTGQLRATRPWGHGAHSRQRSRTRPCSQPEQRTHLSERRPCLHRRPFLAFGHSPRRTIARRVRRGLLPTKGGSAGSGPRCFSRRWGQIANLNQRPLLRRSSGMHSAHTPGRASRLRGAGSLELSSPQGSSCPCGVSPP